MEMEGESLERKKAMQLLGLEENYTEEELKKQYKIYAKKYHPDNEESSDEEKFIRIKEAYEYLAAYRGQEESKKAGAKTGVPCQMCGGSGIRRRQIKTAHGYMAKKEACSYCGGTGVKNGR